MAGATDALSAEPAAAPVADPAAQAPTSTAPTTPEGQAAGSPPAPAPTPAGKWYDSVSPDYHGLIEERAWQSNEDVLKSYQQLQKLQGVSEDKLIKIPHPDDKEAISAMHARLGRPETADAYEIPELGNDPEQTKWFKEQAFNLGLSSDQAKTLSESLLEQGQLAQQKDIEQAGIKATNAYKEIEKSWGANAPAQEDAVKRGLGVIGLSDQAAEGQISELQQFEYLIGTERLVELAIKLGDQVAEPAFPEGNPATGAMTKERAGQELESLHADPEFQKAKLSEIKQVRDGAIAKEKRLMQIHYA